MAESNDRLQLHKAIIMKKTSQKDEFVNNVIRRVKDGEKFSTVAHSYGKTPYAARILVKAYAFKNKKSLEDIFGDESGNVGGRGSDKDMTARIERAKSIIEYVKDGHTVKEASKKFKLTPISIYKDIDWLGYFEPDYVAEYKSIADTHHFGVKAR